MANWTKIIRVDHDFYESDEFNGLRIPDGKVFAIKFPNDSIMTLPIIVRRTITLASQTLDGLPLFKAQERAYFAVPFMGMPQIWIRATDVDVQESAITD